MWRCHGLLKRKTGSLSENEKLLGRLCGVHTDLNCLFHSQSVHPVVCLNHSHTQLVPPGHCFIVSKPQHAKKVWQREKQRTWQQNRIKFTISWYTGFPLLFKETRWFLYNERECENEWGAKRLREGCLKDIDSSNPFTPSPRLGAGAKTQRESRAHRQHTRMQYISVHTYTHVLRQAWKELVQYTV